MNKLIFIAAAGALALAACGSSEKDEREEIRSLPDNFESLSQSEQKQAIREWTNQMSDRDLMKTVDGFYESGYSLQRLAVLQVLRKERREKICKMARDDCAEAANFSQCIEIRHPGWQFDIEMNRCLVIGQ